MADEVCEQTFYQTADERVNNIYTYKFKESALNNMSLIEVRSVVESLYILALCERRKLAELKEDNKGLMPIIFQ